jgi:hypothetical protein
MKKQRKSRNRFDFTAKDNELDEARATISQARAALVAEREARLLGQAALFPVDWTGVGISEATVREHAEGDDLAWWRFASETLEELFSRVRARERAQIKVPPTLRAGRALIDFD